jgi:hypothetical protein
MGKTAAFTLQIAGLAFLFWFGQPIKAVLPVPVILAFAGVYLFGIRAISNWLQFALQRATA